MCKQPPNGVCVIKVQIWCTFLNVHQIWKNNPSECYCDNGNDIFLWLWHTVTTNRTKHWCWYWVTAFTKPHCVFAGFTDSSLLLSFCLIFTCLHLLVWNTMKYSSLHGQMNDKFGEIAVINSLGFCPFQVGDQVCLPHVSLQ